MEAGGWGFHATAEDTWYLTVQQITTKTKLTKLKLVFAVRAETRMLVVVVSV